MDEKDLIKKVRNSFKAKKTRAEILQGFQKRGYKLEYAEKLITKAQRPKKITLVLLITLVLFFSITFSAYTFFSDNQKMQISNPLSGITITETSKSSQSKIQTESQDKTKTYEEIDITPDLVSFLLNEIGAWQLHKNPITFQDPIINLKIDDKGFHSKISSEIKTYQEITESADLQFNTNKKDFIDAIVSDNPKKSIKKSIEAGNTYIEIKASEPELFAKGYLKLYNSLK